MNFNELFYCYRPARIYLRIQGKVCIMWLLKQVLLTSSLRKTLISLSKNLSPACFFPPQFSVFLNHIVKVCSQSQRDFITFFSLVCTGNCIFLYVQMSSDVTLTNDSVNQTISIVSWNTEVIKDLIQPTARVNNFPQNNSKSLQLAAVQDKIKN